MKYFNFKFSQFDCWNHENNIFFLFFNEFFSLSLEFIDWKINKMSLYAKIKKYFKI
jgi:hypothetical protein